MGGRAPGAPPPRSANGNDHFWLPPVDCSDGCHCSLLSTQQKQKVRNILIRIETKGKQIENLHSFKVSYCLYFQQKTGRSL